MRKVYVGQGSFKRFYFSEKPITNDRVRKPFDSFNELIGYLREGNAYIGKLRKRGRVCFISSLPNRLEERLKQEIKRIGFKNSIVTNISDAGP